MDIDKAKDVTIHPNYVAGNIDNNIALIKLPYAISLKTRKLDAFHYIIIQWKLTVALVKTIPINKEATEPADGTVGVITGWGTTSAGKNEIRIITAMK
jgi:hypothetical protein